MTLKTLLRLEHVGRLWAFGSNQRPRLSRQRVVLVLPYILVFLIGMAPAVYLGINDTGAYNSPDETARRLMAESFASKRNLYIQDLLTELPGVSISGPRTFVQHGDRSVPVYSLGHLFLLGMSHLLLGSHAPLALAIVPGLLFVSMALLLRLFVRQSAVVPLMLIGATPIWYWSSRAYMDLGTTFLFVLIGVLCGLHAANKRSWCWFISSGCALAMAALMRHAEAALFLFTGVALASAFIHAHRPVHARFVLLTFVVYSATQIFLFIAPMMLLNWHTYGSPFQVGYAIFYQSAHPDLVPSSESTVAFVFGLFRAAFFPQPTDFPTLLRGMRYQVLGLTPLITVLGVPGLWILSRDVVRRFGGIAVLVGSTALIYVLVSRANPGVYLASQPAPDIRGSLVRYWFPLYIMLGLAAAVAVARMPKAVAIVLVAATCVFAVSGVWTSGPESILALANINKTESQRYATFLTDHTETSAVIFTIRTNKDKWIVPIRRTASTGYVVVSDRDLKSVATAGAALYRRGVPVYYFVGSGQTSEDIDGLQRYLSDAYLALEYVASPDRRASLFRLAVQVRPLELEASAAGAFHCAMESLQVPFVLIVDHDGSTMNMIGNPSFETTLEGWGGPAVGDCIVRSSTHALFGQHSMRMELRGDETAGLRRTYVVVMDQPGNETWSARARVLVFDSYKATVVLQAYVKDYEGNVLARPTASLSRVTEGFETLVIPKMQLPQGAVSVELQVALRPQALGARAVVFWDGLELVPGVLVPGDYCDGDYNGCSWIGAPHQSPSERVGGIQSITITWSTGTALLKGPFMYGDRLFFQDGSVYYLARESTVPEVLGTFTMPDHDVPIEFYVRAGGLPLLTLAPVDLGQARP